MSSLSGAERARLQSVRHRDVRLVLERVPGWRKLATAGLVEILRVAAQPGLRVSEHWVARSTPAGRKLVDSWKTSADLPPS